MFFPGACAAICPMAGLFCGGSGYLCTIATATNPPPKGIIETIEEAVEEVVEAVEEGVEEVQSVVTGEEPEEAEEGSGFLGLGIFTKAEQAAAQSK